jgi:phosphoribosylamine--glycine ligase/phosphoribosylformylglycinamidine cyclo-ligase
MTHKVLLIGSGGREHALAWKLAQSPRLGQLWIAPGNAGTASLGENIPIAAENAAGLVNLAYKNAVDLVIIGPEAPLAAGLTDDLREMGIPVFGPSRLAAQIEASKVFAKAFMQRHAIPTARYATFKQFDAALAYLRSITGDSASVVIKASGLAAGKGVVVPETSAGAEAALRAMMVDQELGDAAHEVIIEERLEGEEVSLLAFTDGTTVKPMPPAQDHKRLLDGDRGPNTGGMGAYAPAPICPPELVNAFTRSVLQPTVDGLRAEGAPFVGVLYAGMMLTAAGPKVLEFNCRFGDPETQAILPLLETDLLDIAEACAQGRLHEVEIRWKAGAAACVVLAAAGYPGKAEAGKLVTSQFGERENAIVFHAGTRLTHGQVFTAGGRVLGVTGWDITLEAALNRAYSAIGQVSFEGMQYRKDIGWRAVKETPSADNALSAYEKSGVSIDAGNRAVDLMEDAVRSTYGPEVLAGIGAFGGLYDAAVLKGMQNPVLVGSTDGVGTKVKLAARAGRYRSAGHDIVNHCIDDILVQGARPLFFLDYFATSKLQPEVVAEVVAGISEACREAGCALLGGETAEMPGVYTEGEFDIAGTIIGVVERQAILPRADLQPGDILIGLRSSGPHTNGYSLIRKIFEGVSLDTVFPELGIPLADGLLAPHRSYLPLIGPILANTPHATQPIKALAHLTGGGFIENIPRVLPNGVGANIRLGSWPTPPLFQLIQRRGNIATEEMHRVFNMGIGMIVIVAQEQATALQTAIPEETWIVGELTSSAEKKVTLS